MYIDNAQKPIAEILTHEIEKYHLDLIHIFEASDRSDFFNYISQNHVSNSAEQLKTEYYQYCRFGEKIDALRKSNSRQLKQLIKRILSDGLSSIKINDKWETQLYQHISAITLLLTTNLYDHIYQTDFLKSENRYANPYSLKLEINDIKAHYFPVEFQQFLAYLAANDTEFWDKIYCSVGAILQVAAKDTYIPNKTELIDTLTSDTFLILQKNIIGKQQKFDNVLHLRSHIFKIAQLKLYEYFRKHKSEKNVELIDNFAEFNNNQEDMYGVENTLYTDNEEDKSQQYLIFLLLDKENPIRAQLVEGEEDAVEMFIAVKTGESNYQEWMTEHGCATLSHSELQKKYVNHRQEMSRLKFKLIKRFYYLMHHDISFRQQLIQAYETM